MWSDADIERQRAWGEIKIEPWDDKSLQPASVDLRLGNMFRRQRLKQASSVLDAKSLFIPDFFTDIIVEEESIVIEPQEFVLGITKEKISLSDRVVGRLEGKSSLARIGISVHSTGGFIDPGNQNLNITLEIVNHLRFPVRLYVDMWIAQIAFDSLETKCKIPYGAGKSSRYFGDSEPVASKIAEKLK